MQMRVHPSQVKVQIRQIQVHPRQIRVQTVITVMEEFMKIKKQANLNPTFLHSYRTSKNVFINYLIFMYKYETTDVYYEAKILFCYQLINLFFFFFFAVCQNKLLDTYFFVMNNEYSIVRV